MFGWIEENIGTILICLALVGLITLILVWLRKDKKKGKCSCGGQCACCPMADTCHKTT